MFEAPESVAAIPKPHELVAVMDGAVAGLEEAKAALAVHLYRFAVAAVLDRPHRPSNVLVLGPSGSGKTYLLRALLDACPVIHAEVVTTEYSDVGFSGRDLTSCYLPLWGPRWQGQGPGKIKLADAIANAERFGVVVLDEFDKLRVVPGQTLGERQGAKAQAMQSEMLKLVEGAEVVVKARDSDSGFAFHTHRVLHIACGAFEGIGAFISDQTHAQDAHMRAGVLDIIRYGFMPELVGRFSLTVALPRPTMVSVLRILRDGLIPRYEAEMVDMGLRLQVDDGALNWWAGQALQTPIGARALEPMIQATLSRAIHLALAGGGDTLVVGSDEAARQMADVR